MHIALPQFCVLVIMILLLLLICHLMKFEHTAHLFSAELSASSKK